MDAAPAALERPKRGKEFTRRVGARIAFWREYARMSQTVAAKRANLSASHLCNMEKGERAIDIEKLHVIAKTLGRKVADFLPVTEGGAPLAGHPEHQDEIEND